MASCEVADIFILNTVEDKDDASALKDFIEFHCPSLLIWITHDLDLSSLGNTIQQVMKNKGFILCLLTKTFCENRICNTCVEAATAFGCEINESRLMPIETQSKRCTDPSKKYEIPFFLKCQRSVRIFRLTKGENISKLSKKELMENGQPYDYEAFVMIFKKIESKKLPV